MPKRDPYDVLGVERGAALATVKAAWRRLARAHHPDLSGSDPAAARAATARMAEINAAYDALLQRDAERRAGLSDAFSPNAPGSSADRGPQGTGGATRPRGGPPRARPSRPVTGRVDTSGTFRARNATMGPGIRMHGSGAPPRARPADREPPRASEPTGPLRRGRVRRFSPPPEPSLEEARAMELRFGKFHGHTLGQVADFEPSYIDWLSVTISHDPDLVSAARVIRRQLDAIGVRRRTRPAARGAQPAD